MTRSGVLGSHMPQHLQHRSYSEYDRSLPYVPYGTYNTANPYERINREGGWIPPGEVSLHHYQRYSDAEAFRSPGLESSSPYGKSNYTHLFTPPSYAGQPSPSFGHHTGRVHLDEWRNPVQDTYGRKINCTVLRAKAHIH